MKVFEPLMMNSSPSRTARVLIEATSEPASGSVMPRQRIFSPVIAGTAQSCFCCSVPNARIGGIAMSVCTAMPIAHPPEHRVGEGRLLPLLGVGRELFDREVADRLAQLFVLVGEDEMLALGL